MATANPRGQEAFTIKVGNWRLVSYIMFHATNPSCVESILQNGFRKSVIGNLGKGVYVSRDVEKARNYGKVIFKLVVYTGKVRRVKERDQPDRLHWQQDFDSAWIPAGTGVGAGTNEENCIKEPWQVKVLGVCVGYEELPSNVQNTVKQVDEKVLTEDEKAKIKDFKDMVKQKIKEKRL